MRIHPALESLAARTAPPARRESEAPEDFGQLLMDVLKEVNQSQQNARELETAFLTGRPVEVHDLMIALEKASLGMQLTLQVRNKLLEAYQELMRIQI